MILRVAIVVPTYNNPTTIKSVIANLLTQTSHSIFVYDDGSELAVEKILESHSRLKIVRSEINMGKGATLARAIKDLSSQGFTHMLTFDGDGQHLAQECKNLVAEAIKDPWCLVIGSRKLETSENVPGISKFGRKFSNFWVKYQTDLKIADSQSGMRLYPLFHVQSFTFWTTRFDFEIEILIRLIWNHIRVKEVNVEVYYPPKEDRVSHFNKLWDNVRISLLNTILVCVSLLRSHLGAKQVALSVGLGAFIGFTPLFGFQTLLALAVAFIFRLNAMAIILGTQVSLPPFIPFIILSSTLVGKRIFNVQSDFYAWLSGSLVTGMAAGTILGLCCFLFMSRKKVEAQNWNGKSRGGKFGNGFLVAVMRTLGLKWAYACLFFIIPYFYFFAPKARRSSNQYWKIIAPDTNFFARQVRVLKQLWTFATVLLDRVYFSFSDAQPFTVKSHGLEELVKFRDQEKGAVLISSHVGAWDLASASMHRKKFERNLYVLKYVASGFTFDKVKAPNDPTQEQLVTSQPLNTQEPQPVLRIRELLDGGHLVGVMADRPIGSRLELIPVFGRLAVLDTTPFYIASLMKISVFATFGFKESNQRYFFFAKELPPPQLSSRQLQCYQWAKNYVAELEEMTGRYPYQWFNFFPFWSGATSQQELSPSATERNFLAEELSTQQNLAPGPALVH